MKQETIARLEALKTDRPKAKLEAQMIGESLELSLYGVIDSCSPNSADNFKAVMDEYGKNAAEINLRINSIGGLISEGFAIYEMLRSHPAKVNIKVDGLACSMASMICMAGDRVTMGPASMMMIHNPMSSITGNADEMRAQADRLDAQAEAARKAYLLKSNGKISEELLIDLMDAETFLKADECKAYGFCDEVVDDSLMQAQAEISSLKAEIAELKAKLNNQAREPEQPSNRKKGWLF